MDKLIPVVRPARGEDVMQRLEVSCLEPDGLTLHTLEEKEIDALSSCPLASVSDPHFYDDDVWIHPTGSNIQPISLASERRCEFVHSQASSLVGVSTASWPNETNVCRRRKARSKAQLFITEDSGSANNMPDLEMGRICNLAIPSFECFEEDVHETCKGNMISEYPCSVLPFLHERDTLFDASGPCPFLTYGTDHTTFLLAACSRNHAASLTYLSLRVRGLTRAQILSIPYPWLPRAPSLEQSIVCRTVSDSFAGSANAQPSF